MKRVALIAMWFLFTVGTTHADAYDFDYSYGNPTLAASQSYIDSTDNAVLFSEGIYRYWKPIAGAATEALTSPGVITYHFNFAEVIDEAHLSLRLDTFHWSYSEGHNFLFASTDGSNWQQLSEVLPPAFGAWTGGGWNGLLPDAVVGMNDIWLQARLYSYGPSAASGGVWTNTAQLSRYDVNANTLH